MRPGNRVAGNQSSMFRYTDSQHREWNETQQFFSKKTDQKYQ